MEKINILGIEISNVDLQEALEFCVSRIKQGWHTKVYTPNSEMIVESVRDRSFEEILIKGDLLIPDGIGLIKAAKFYKKEFKGKVAGVDLTMLLLEKACEEGFSVYLLGGKPETAKLAAENIEKKYQGIKLVGFRDGYFDYEEEEKIVSEIKVAGADIILVALGMKKQEDFIERYLEQSGALLGIGMGGTVDVLAGTVSRAPEFYIKYGLEWLYRFIKQPSRFFRMLDLPRFVFLCFIDSMNKR